VTSGTASTQGASSDAIYVSSTSGAVKVASTTATATGSGSDAIHVASTSGPVTVTIADGGAATSTSGYGVYVNTGGAATINAGVSAGTATVSGGSWGVYSQATGGTTLNISATVTGAGGAAIDLKGGSSVINNLSNTIIGYLDLTSANNTVNNAGVWDAYGVSNFYGVGVSTVNNSGQINAATAISTPTTVTFKNLQTLNNSGVISLSQTGGATAHTGDVLDLGSAAYVGSGGAKLLLDVNLGNAAVGTSAAQSADLLKAGSASGSTTIVLNDVGGAVPATLNFTGIRLVTAATSTANAFTLQGGAVTKGFVSYQLAADGTNTDLVGLPSSAVFETVKVGVEAQSFWRRSGDAWAEEMRTPRGEHHDGVTFWAQFEANGESAASHPTYTVQGLQTFTFNPNLSTQTTWYGGQAGVEFAKGGWGVGLTSGYGDQRSRFRANSDTIDLSGYNIGAYARVSNGGFFADGLVKYDGYDAKLGFTSAGFADSFNGYSVGFEGQTGYHFRSGPLFMEPVASFSWTGTHLDGFNNVSAGAAASYGHTDSVYGSLGVRAGLDHRSGDVFWSPYVGAYGEGEMGSHNVSNFATGGVAMTNLADQIQPAHARIELGVTGRNLGGLEGFAKIDGQFGEVSGVAGKVGLSWRW
jgi:hypothetical protein